jgi:hypothetical protein
MVTVDGVAYNISAPGGIDANPFTFTVNLTEVISNACVCTMKMIDVAHTTQAGSKTVSLYYDGKVTAQAVAVSVVSGAQPCQHTSCISSTICYDSDTCGFGVDCDHGK